MDEPNVESLVSVVVPVYNEGENIQVCLRRLDAALKSLPHEILVCYDFDQDTTLPAIQAMPDILAALRLVKNDLGRGVIYALQAGFQAARGDVIVTTMADLSDPPEVIPAMVAKVRQESADVVSGSRYMKGGSQSGGPLLKRTLSRLAGLALHWLTGIPTHDPTTNFRAYRASYLRQVQVESSKGFEVALELTVKAHVLGFRVDEVPSSWQDRSAGQSRFKLWAWLPQYLRWMFYGIFGAWFRRNKNDASTGKTSRRTS
jgi:dolichol-phosphate mannosyltransferase